MWDKDNLIRELDQIDPEKLRVSPPAPPSQLQILRAEVQMARCELEELNECGDLEERLAAATALADLEARLQRAEATRAANTGASHG